MLDALSYQITDDKGQGEVLGASPEEAIALVLETIATAKGEVVISARHLDLELKLQGGKTFEPETIRLVRRMVESIPGDMKAPLNLEGSDVWLRMGNYL
jgi:hypothetical protein